MPIIKYMAETNLTQSEAESLLRMEKVRLIESTVPFPQPGEAVVYLLRSKNGREDFLLDVRRGRLSLSKCTYQNRARTVVPLARLDVAGSNHRNPNDTVVECPHIHIYREGYGDKWAWPASDYIEVLPSSLIDIYHKFCDFCAIIEPPLLQGSLF